MLFCSDSTGKTQMLFNKIEHLRQEVPYNSVA